MKILILIGAFLVAAGAQANDGKCLVDVSSHATPSVVYQEVEFDFDQPHRFNGEVVYLDGSTKPFDYTFTVSRFAFFETNYLYLDDNRSGTTMGHHIATATTKGNEVSLFTALAPGDAGGININCVIN